MGSLSGPIQPTTHEICLQANVNSHVFNQNNIIYYGLTTECDAYIWRSTIKGCSIGAETSFLETVLTHMSVTLQKLVIVPGFNANSYILNTDYKDKVYCTWVRLIPLFIHYIESHVRSTFGPHGMYVLFAGQLYAIKRNKSQSF